MNLARQRVEWPTAQGLSLVGYTLARGELTVIWTVDALDEARNGWIYGPYAHFGDAQNRLLANLDAPGLPGYEYRLGDVFIWRMPVPALPQQPVWLELGLFDGLHQLGITFLPAREPPQPFFRVWLNPPPAPPR